MPDFRSYCPTLSPDNPLIQLSNDESHHLVSVNRARSGDPVSVFDGQGQEWESELTEANKRKAILTGKRFIQNTPLSYEIALAQAIPKGKGLEGIIRKATEIGIQHIFPLASERTESKVRTDRQDTKSEKWLTAAIEGAKQSGNPFLPQIHPVQDLSHFLENGAQQFSLKLIASLQSDSVSLKTAIDSTGVIPTGIFLVGPEGDFSDREYHQISSSGFLPITLGPYVLKCETAAVYAMSILRHEWSSS